ncbi:unnamed protein product [Mytilus coruscus]|uniref:C-type lectin domain-containing protein n=1 Tax=Mytilus coruscus TaxID=42192 RepID=A0A6J8EQ36_MYTCO|nr:unnamed protein product [Mytilus coruscus]
MVLSSFIKEQMFYPAAAGNIDHNPSSTTSKSSFDWTGIFFFQHPMKENGDKKLIRVISSTNKPKSKSTIYKVYSETTWSQASQACGSQGLENDDSILRTVNISDGQEFWIGIAVYSVLTKWIEEIGCFQRSTIHMNKHASSLGHCSILCQTENYFGYKNTLPPANCICLPNGIDKLKRADLSECERSSSIHTLSVFKRFSGQVLASSNPGNCATLCCGNCQNVRAQKNKWESRDCFTPDIAIVSRCGRNNSSYERIGPTFRYELKYRESRQFCVSYNQLLISSTFCEEHTLNGVTAWTNVFRQRIEVNSSALNVGTHKGTRTFCFVGTLQTTNGTRKLVKYRDQCNRQLERYICKARIEMETTSSSLKSTSAFLTEMLTSATDKEASGIEKETTSLSTSIKSTSVFLTEMFTSATYKEASDDQPDVDDKREKRANWVNQNGALIGGILSGVAVLTVVISLAVCKFRSIGPFKSGDAIKNQSVIFSNNLEEGKTNKTLLNQPHSSDKFQMVNKNERAGTGVADVDNIYTDSSNGEYDLLNDLQRWTIRLQENVYDSNAIMHNQDDQTYDRSVFRTLCHEGDVNDYSLASRRNSGDYDYALNYKAESGNENDIYDKTC